MMKQTAENATNKDAMDFLASKVDNGHRPGIPKPQNLNQKIWFGPPVKPALPT